MNLSLQAIQIGEMSLPEWVVTLPIGTLVFIGAIAFVIKRLLFICRPNEILILSGRNYQTLGGKSVGFRVIHGGRALKVPIIEQMARMDVSLITVPMSVQGAYSEGGIPLTVHAVANVKISSDPKFVGNALERLLGRGREEVARMAKETLEGQLRGVIATMTPEEVNEDRLKFAKMLRDEAEEELHGLGMQLDTLKIQHVADDRNYLLSLGRKRIAEILSFAEVAESDAVRAAEESEAAAKARGDIARTRAKANIQRKTNELRQIVAELDAEARSEEERAVASAQEARAQAEQELQRIRGELEQLRLTADITIPAEVDRKVSELLAAGEASRIFTDGEAAAEAVSAIAGVWKDAGKDAMDIYVLQNLEEIFGEVTRAAGQLEVEEVNVVDGGAGEMLPSYAAAYPKAVGSLLAEITATLGVDLPAIMSGDNVLEQAVKRGE